MSLNRDDLRVDAKVSSTDIPIKHTASYNRCYGASTNRNQAGLLAGWSADERTTIEARLWSKVNKEGSCWLWTASTLGGYGQFTFGLRGRSQVHIYAHRLSYEFICGPIPNGLNVLHRCDVPGCVRPEHLFVGTQAENLADARAKGRLDTRGPRTQKLSLSDRLAIYHTPHVPGICVALAQQYGVSKVCISVIRRGRFAGAPTVQQQVA